MEVLRKGARVGARRNARPKQNVCEECRWWCLAGKAKQGIPVVRESESDAQPKPSESTHIAGHAKNAALQVAQLCRLVKIS